MHPKARGADVAGFVFIKAAKEAIHPVIADKDLKGLKKLSETSATTQDWPEDQYTFQLNQRWSLGRRNRPMV